MGETVTARRQDAADRHQPPVLAGIDHVEWWVGNARAFSAFLASAFGFEFVAYAGPETGRRDRVSYVLEQGEVRFLVTGALTPDSPIAEHVRAHGDGVRDVCFRVDDAAAAFEAAVARGGLPERPPATDADEDGEIHHAAIRTYGETVHTFLDRSGYGGPFAPGFVPAALTAPAGPAVGLTRYDHIVGNVEKGRLDDWVEYYCRVLGFDPLVHFDDEQISTQYSALMSTVVWNHDSVVLPINEPAEGLRKSQIEEYLDYYRSPGVQHIALRTADIVATVRALRDRGVRFLTVPPEYYEDARERMAGVDLPWADLQELGILVDRDRDGHLLQIFTENVCDRPTVFFEIIQREGATGFGAGNFKALFEAIERAQAARGNL
ncbi:MAG: 4-hydroxyphenylpyruvate dioxygenase [Thermoanaerobacterales bacterium]|nr:4-hydroxyphenylpyruvate dioxygenase [Thermoanaerobacterales bacterium]